VGRIVRCVGHGKGFRVDEGCRLPGLVKTIGAGLLSPDDVGVVVGRRLSTVVASSPSLPWPLFPSMSVPSASSFGTSAPSSVSERPLSLLASGAADADSSLNPSPTGASIARLMVGLVVRSHPATGGAAGTGHCGTGGIDGAPFSRESLAVSGQRLACIIKSTPGLSSFSRWIVASPTFGSSQTC
jgi:hypothetical protein